MTSGVSSLYKNAKVFLWVEDSLTKTWLDQVWQDTDIKMLVAGGNDAVFGAVKDAREAGHTNVFGLRDRDFIASNQSDWLVQTKDPTVFVPNVHEIENLLLDFDGLANLGSIYNPPRLADYNPQGRSGADLRVRALLFAQHGLWWMAARATIADARMLVTADFPRHPKLGTSVVASRSSAQAQLELLLLQSAWGVSLRTQLPTMDKTWIADRLAQHETNLQDNLTQGTWLEVWSGKELWRHILGLMTNAKVTAAVEADFAKALAEHQRVQGTVDPLMSDLRTALRKRTGLEGW